jgi:hypothetical protein
MYISMRLYTLCLSMSMVTAMLSVWQSIECVISLKLLPVVGFALLTIISTATFVWLVILASKQKNKETENTNDR